jgi:hypothetical protein
MFNKIRSTFETPAAGLSVAAVNRRKDTIQKMLNMSSSASTQGERDVNKLLSAAGNNMQVLAPAACFSVDPSTLIAGNGREEEQALIGGHVPTSAAMVAPASSSYGANRSVGVSAASATGVTGNKAKYLPLLPMV